jgi:hypothetical protein
LPNYLTVYLTYSRAMRGICHHDSALFCPHGGRDDPVRNSEVGGAPAIECFARKKTLILAY